MKQSYLTNERIYLRAVEPEDIRRSNRLMYGTAILGILICLLIRIAVGFWVL